MGSRKNLSRCMGKRTLSIYLSDACRGLRILAVDTRTVLGGGGTCSDLRTRVPLVALILRHAFTRPGTSRAYFPSFGKRFARFLCSPSRISLWPVQIAKRDSIASFTTTLGASYRTPALRPHFLEIQRIWLCDALAAEICRVDRALARSQ